MVKLESGDSVEGSRESEREERKEEGSPYCSMNSAVIFNNCNCQNNDFTVGERWERDVREMGKRWRRGGRKMGER